MTGLALLHRRQSRSESLLQQPDITGNGNKVVTHGCEGCPLLGVDRQAPHRFAVLLGGRKGGLLGPQEVGMVEGSGLAKRD